MKKTTLLFLFTHKICFMRLSFIFFFSMLLSWRVSAQIITEKAYQPHWDSYETNDTNGICDTKIDMNLIDIVPLKKHNYLLSVVVKSNRKYNEQTVSSDEEALTQSKIENELLRYLTAKYKFVYIGNTIRKIVNIFYFYTNQGLQNNEIQIALSQNFKNHSFIQWSLPDDEWTTYFKLYPNEEQMQTMANKKSLSELEKQKISLSDEKEIFHTLHFTNDWEYEKPKQELVKLGYTVVAVNQLKVDNKFIYELIVKQLSALSLAKLNQVTSQIMKLVSLYHGDYIGWELLVRKK
jgi:hypothetical protein